jgi:hypothetical protein
VRLTQAPRTLEEARRIKARTEELLARWSPVDLEEKKRLEPIAAMVARLEHANRSYSATFARVAELEGQLELARAWGLELVRLLELERAVIAERPRRRKRA